MCETGSDIERAALEALEAVMDEPLGQRRKHLKSNPDLSDAVRERALRLLEYEELSEKSLRTGAAGQDFEVDEKPPKQIGAYRVLRLIGRGGMGNVYLAERASGDFDRVVAIKLIKKRLTTPDIVERFRRERQILAELNHPHIARLYDGGETEDGAPYFVMEYVDGQPLHHWLKQRKPDKEEALQAFAHICEAVASAHQHLVVHRDLTPPNILISDGGDVKLIDFGIARPDSDDKEPDLSSGLSFTPGFSAPERKDGGTATVLSDIYSLGKLLDMLAVSFADAELDAMVRKACAKDPAARYRSASALLADIEAHRDNRPIAAIASSRFYIARKFVERQKLLSAMTVLFTIGLVGALIATAIAYRQEGEARQEAEQRFDETHAIASTMMFDVYDEVSMVSASTKARAFLAESAQKYLDSLAADKNAPVDVRIDAGLGYLRLAQIVGGDVRGNTLGDHSEGQENFAKSRALLQELYEQHPERPDVKAAFGRALTAIAGERLLVESDIKTGLADTTLAIELLTGINNKDEQSSAAFILAYRYQGDALTRLPKVEEAEASFKAGLTNAEEYSRAWPASVEIMRANAELRQTYAGFLYYFRKKESEAERMFEQSVAVRRTILKATNNAPDDKFKLLFGLYYLGLTELAMGLDADAYRHAREAYDLAESERIANPDSRSQEALLAGMQMLYGQTLSKKGKHRQAVEVADQSIALMRRRHAQNPDSGSGTMVLAVRLHQAANIFATAGLKMRSCDAMHESVNYMQKFDRRSGLPIVNRKEDLVPMLAKLKSC